MPPPSSPSSSSSSFSLVARDLAREHGAHTVLDGVDVSVGPRTRLGVVGPNGVGKTTLLRLLAGLERPDRGVVTAHAARRCRRLPAAGARAPRRETLLAFLARRTGVDRRRSRAGTAAAALADGRTPGADDAYAAALDALPRRSAVPTSTRARRAVCDDLGLPADLLDVPTARAVGRPGGPRLARRHPAQPVRRAPARRAHQRPRLRRARPPGGGSSTSSRAAWWS